MLDLTDRFRLRAPALAEHDERRVQTLPRRYPLIEARIAFHYRAAFMFKHPGQALPGKQMHINDYDKWAMPCRRSLNHIRLGVEARLAQHIRYLLAS